jgi:hypothetical protein
MPFTGQTKALEYGLGISRVSKQAILDMPKSHEQLGSTDANATQGQNRRF